MAVNSVGSTTSLDVLPGQSAEAQDERNFILFFIKYPEEPVLDVGTGDCACVASILARQGYGVVASDRDGGTIQSARRFLAQQGARKRVRLIRDDIAASRLKSASFLNIVCFNVLHHVPEYDNALGELHRILAPQGRLIVADYDEDGTGFLEKLQKAVHRHFDFVTVYRRPQERLLLVCEN